MWYVVKVGIAKRMLFDIKDNVKSFLVEFWSLERLNVGKMSSCLVVAFVFLYRTSRPNEIGVDGVYILFPITTIPFKLIHAKS